MTIKDVTESKSKKKEEELGIQELREKRGSKISKIKKDEQESKL